MAAREASAQAAFRGLLQAEGIAEPVPFWVHALALASAFGLVALLMGRFPGIRLGPTEGRREEPRWTFADVLMTFAVYFLTLTALAGLLDLAGVDPQKDPGALTALQSGSIACATGFVILVVGRLHRQRPQALGLARPSAGDLTAALAAFLLSFLPLNVFADIWTGFLVGLGMEQAEQTAVVLFREAVAAGNPITLLTSLLGGVVVAPFCEEVVFRGFLYGLLRARIGVWPGVLLSSLLFALPHWPPFAMGPIFAVGVLLAWIYERSGTLFTPIAYHALFNATSYLILFLNAGGGAGGAGS